MALLIIIAVLWFVGWLVFRESAGDRAEREAREAAQRETDRQRREADAKIQVAEQARRAVEAEAAKQAAQMQAQKGVIKEEALVIRRALTSAKAKRELDEQMRAAGIELVKRRRRKVLPKTIRKG
jgi:hypothetical protein